MSATVSDCLTVSSTLIHVAIFNFRLTQIGLVRLVQLAISPLSVTLCNTLRTHMRMCKCMRFIYGLGISIREITIFIHTCKNVQIQSKQGNTNADKTDNNTPSETQMHALKCTGKTSKHQNKSSHAHNYLA